MNKHSLKIESRKRRHGRVRSRVSGTPDTPRLSVFRSNANITAQLIDDTKGITLGTVSSLSVKDKTTKTEQAHVVGKKIAELAKAKGVEKVAFDRGGYLYHGRVKAVAEGAREGGLKF